MNRRTIAIGVFAAMSIHMMYLVIVTSLQSNLFTEWNALAQVPWLVTTVKDFYQILVPFCLWTLYKEKSWLIGTLWVISFIALGSITTSFYVVLKILELKPEEPLQNIFTRKNPA